MSPALLEKYLQAARDVADHMVLKPDGFAFAPHPMLVDTDRDKYCVKRIVDFYKRQPTDYSRLFPGRVALQAPRRARQAEGHAARDGGRERRSARSIWRRSGRRSRRRETTSGRSRSCRRMWRALPAPKGAQPDLRRARGCDADARLRGRSCARRPTCSHGPPMHGISGATQPFLMWRNRQYAANRRTSTRRPAGRGRSAAVQARPMRGPERRQKSKCGRRASPDVATIRRRRDPDLHVPGRRARALRGGVRALRRRVSRHVLRLRARPLLPRQHARQGPAPQRRLPQPDGLLPRRRPALRARSSTRRGRRSWTRSGRSSTSSRRPPRGPTCSST